MTPTMAALVGRAGGGGSCAPPQVKAQGLSTAPGRGKSCSARPPLSSACTGGSCTEPLTQANWEMGWEEEGKTSNRKLRITLLILRWKILSTTSSRKLQREGHYPEKERRSDRPREAQMPVRGGGGCLLGLLTRFPFFKVSISTIVCWP